jgi:hypothetical protein
VTDSQSGFRAFAGRSKDVFRFGQNGLAIESEMLADAAAAGLRIKEVEIGVRYDVGSSSEHPVAHGVRVLIKVLHDMELLRPLFHFTLPRRSILYHLHAAAPCMPTCLQRGSMLTFDINNQYHLKCFLGDRYDFNHCCHAGL